MSELNPKLNPKSFSSPTAKGLSPRQVRHFWERVNRMGRWTVGLGICWEWTGPLIQGKGYGKGPNARPAHRIAYELKVGPVPEGLQLDHLCRNRRCVNPEHLQPVTCRENLMRGDTAAAHRIVATRCIRGHLFDDTQRDGRGHRVCRTCARERSAVAYRARTFAAESQRTKSKERHDL